MGAVYSAPRRRSTDWDESRVAFDELQEDAERERGEEKRGPEPCGISDEETATLG
jgi:hypothetical protein